MMRLHTAMIGGLAMLTAAACASVERPDALRQAEDLYSQLQSNPAAERYAEAELMRTRLVLDSARTAFENRRNMDYVNALSYVALRQAQTARAELDRGLAQAAADSLREARLRRLLALSNAQRQQLAQQQRLSQEEIEMLRQRNLLVSAEAEAQRQRADSLRRAAEEAEARLNDALMQLRTLVAEITNIRETARGLVISLSDILFDVDKATLKAGAEANIRRIAAILNQFPDYQISVEGHTDATGSDSYNQQLSERRAAAVRAALVAGGVAQSRITSGGYGESQPIATNETVAGRQQNRRVEVIVLGAGKMADVMGTPGADTTRPPQ